VRDRAAGESSKNVYDTPPVIEIGRFDPPRNGFGVGLARLLGLFQDRIEG